MINPKSAQYVEKCRIPISQRRYSHRLKDYDLPVATGIPADLSDFKLVAVSGTAVPNQSTTTNSLAKFTFLNIFAVALILCVVSLYLLQSNQTRAHEEKIQALADLGANLATTSTGQSDDPARTLLFKYWSTAAIHAGTVHGCLLSDPIGKIEAYEPPDLVATHELPTQIPVGTPTLQPNPESPSLSKPATKLFWATGDSGSHLALLAPPRDTWGDFASNAKFIILLTLLLTAGGTVLLCLLQKRMVHQPLHQLVAATASGAEETPKSLPRSHGKFGQLAANIERILDDWHTVRARVGRMERTLDERVADQTRAIENLLTKAEQEAWIDPLTQLGNRRLLEDRLESVVSEQRENDQDIAIAIFDLDNFKPLNDQKGHAAGDDILRFVGELLRGSLRSTDIGLRYGGDEFVAILLDTSAEEAAPLADRIIKLFAQRASTLGVTPKTSMTVGIASLLEHKPTDGHELMSFADAALYVGKRAGKAQVTIYDPKLTAIQTSKA